MPPRFHRARLGVWLVVLWVVAGCAAHTLREAQDSFNKGADIELRAMDRSWLSDNPDASPSDTLAALNSYRLANSVATKLIDQESSSLKADNLLGATYVLKAMALWRISDLEGNRVQDHEAPKATAPDKKPPTNTRQELLSILSQIKQLQEKSPPEITLGTRDRVLHRALFGFYDHDGGRNEGNYTKARVWFQSANERLKESLTGDVPAQHPIRVYVGSARLRTLAAWNQAIYVARRTSAVSEEIRGVDQNEVNSVAKEVVCELRPFWEKNEGIKASLVQLLSTMGLPSAMAQCN